MQEKVVWLCYTFTGTNKECVWKTSVITQWFHVIKSTITMILRPVFISLKHSHEK